MFECVNTKDSNLEITANPDILFNKDIPVSDIRIHGLKLQDHADTITVVNISTTTFEQVPSDMLYFMSGGTRFSWKDNRVFYETSNGLKEYSLNERIKSVLEFGGILHMQSGAKYVIKDGCIVGLGIQKDLLEPYKKISKDTIEEKFGKASRIQEYSEYEEGTLSHTEYILEKKNINIIFSDLDKEIVVINLGDFPYNKTKSR